MKRKINYVILMLLFIHLGCQKRSSEELHENGALKANGKQNGVSLNSLTDGFLIGVYWPPLYEQVNDTSFGGLGQAHVDILQYVITYSEAQNLSILDKAGEFGIRANIFDARAYGTDSDIADMVNAYKDHPALAGYYIKDEPNLTQLDWAANIYQKILLNDSEHLPHVNLFPSLAVPGILGNIDYKTDYVQAWIDKVGSQNLKYLSVDIYPFLYDGTFQNVYYTDLDAIRQIALSNGDIKTSAYLQSVGITGAYRRPNANELKFNVYSMLAYGIKFPVWFTYFTPVNQGEPFTNAIIDSLGNPTDLYTPFQALNAEMKALGTKLIQLQSLAVYHTGTTIPAGTSRQPTDFFIQPDNQNDELLIAYYKNWAENRNYVMLVNKSLTTQKTCLFNIAGWISSIQEISKADGSEIASGFNTAAYTLSETFMPGEGKLLVFN